MTTIDSNNPKLTAYVLGELSAEETAQIKEQIGSDPSLRAAVDEIRQTTELVQQQLRSEPVLGLSDEERQTILEGPPPVLNSPAVFRVKTAWKVAGMALAACIAIAVTLPFLLPPAEQNLQLAIDQRMPDENVGHLKSSVGEPIYEAVKKESKDSESAQITAVTDGLKSGIKNNEPIGAREDALAMKPDSSMVEFPWQRGRAKDDLSSTMHVAQPPAKPSQPGRSISPSYQPSQSRQIAQGGGAGGGGGITGEVADRDSNELRSEMPIPGIAGAYSARVDEYALILREQEEFNREGFNRIVDNPFVRAVDEPRSTFSIDVDTASYSNVRRFLNSGQLAPKDAVRIEEMLNYFNYPSYEPPTGEEPFSANVEINAAPWNPNHRLVRIGLRGKDVKVDMRPATNLVFLLDVSGSMNNAKKLPLVKEGMKLLVDNLNADDRLAIATYAGNAGVALESIYCTPENKPRIVETIDRLGAGGSTHGSAGITQAYELAQQNFIKDGANRVILCTDGDFNVGVSSDAELIRLIEEKRETGVFLSVLGFGTGNYQDTKMEQLANHGNGQIAYIDSIKEAKKVLVEQMAGTLIAIAKDVKTQVDFNPAKVGAYRLIGYENRALAARDFTDDTKDAGEIGAGHTVTALYEIIPADGEIELPETPKSDFIAGGQVIESDLLFKLKLRYKEPDGDTSTELVIPITDSGAELTDATSDFQFASAVAGFGMILRDSPHKGDVTFASVLDLAEAGMADDANGHRAEFIELVKKAQMISNE